MEYQTVKHVISLKFDHAFAGDKWEAFDVGDLAGLTKDGRAVSGSELQATKLLSQIFEGDEIALATSFKMSLPQRGKDIQLAIKQPNFETEVDELLRTAVLKFNDGKFEYQGE